MIPMSRDWFGFDGSNPRTIPKFEFFCKQWRGDCLLLFWKWTFRAIGHWQCWAEYFYRRTHREGRPIYPGWQVTTPLPPSGSRVMACNRPPPAKDTHLEETAYSLTLSITIYVYQTLSNNERIYYEKDRVSILSSSSQVCQFERCICSYKHRRCS